MHGVIIPLFGATVRKSFAFIRCLQALHISPFPFQFDRNGFGCDMKAACEPYTINERKVFNTASHGATIDTSPTE
jgi:hypothetical protein